MDPFNDMYAHSAIQEITPMGRDAVMNHDEDVIFDDVKSRFQTTSFRNQALINNHEPLNLTLKELQKSASADANKQVKRKDQMKKPPHRQPKLEAFSKTVGGPISAAFNQAGTAGFFKNPPKQSTPNQNRVPTTQPSSSRSTPYSYQQSHSNSQPTSQPQKVGKRRSFLPKMVAIGNYMTDRNLDINYLPGTFQLRCGGNDPLPDVDLKCVLESSSSDDVSVRMADRANTTEFWIVIWTRAALHIRYKDDYEPTLSNAGVRIAPKQQIIVLMDDSGENCELKTILEKSLKQLEYVFLNP
jgi:hypothetical protein